jgi:hypothetical protein
VSVQVEYLSDLLRVAIEAGFDWVYYANQGYVRLSVIPDGKLMSPLSLSLLPLSSLSLSPSLLPSPSLSVSLSVLSLINI